MESLEKVIKPVQYVFRRSAIFTSPEPEPVPPVHQKVLLRLEWAVLTGYLLMIALTIYRSTSIRLFWFDELFTLHLSRSMTSLPVHLMNGADQNPPLGYLLTALSTALFGEEEWAVRLPALIGALMSVVGLYWFVRHRRGAFEATLAVSILTASAPVWIYFLEARPYGLAIGFSSLAFVTWQRRWPILFACCIVLGLCSHYYFAVTIFTLVIAGAVRSLQSKMIDRKFATAIVVSGLVLAAMYPFWGQTSRSYSRNFWSKPKLTLTSIESAYAELARRELAVPFAFALVAGVLCARSSTQSKDSYPTAEAVLIAAIAASPALGVLVGSKLVGMYHYRYTLPAMGGLSIAFAYAIGRLTGNHRGVLAACAACFVIFGLVGSERATVGHFRAEAKMLHETADFLNRKADGIVLVESPFEYVRLWHYHPEVEVSYIADIDLARIHTKSDTIDRGLRSLEPIAHCPLHTPDRVKEQLSQGKTLYYFGNAANWHRTELEQRGIRFQERDQHLSIKFFELRIDPGK